MSNYSGTVPLSYIMLKNFRYICKNLFNDEEMCSFRIESKPGVFPFFNLWTVSFISYSLIGVFNKSSEISWVSLRTDMGFKLFGIWSSGSALFTSFIKLYKFSISTADFFYIFLLNLVSSSSLSSLLIANL